MAHIDIESLYEDDNNNPQEGGNDLIPSDFHDPSFEDDDGDIDEFSNEDDFMQHQSVDEGDVFEEDEEMHGPSNVEETADVSIINELLKSKGITDPKAIKYENDEGEIEEFDFYSLPYEDQLEILSSNEVASTDNGLSDHETEVVNLLREQNLTLEDIVEFVKREAIEDYERQNSGKSFVVDSYEDAELFLMDLKLNYEDLNDEELQTLLEKELEHEELFKKKMSKIRSQYVDLELREREEADTQKQALEAQEFETLSTSLIESAVALEDIGGITLEDLDKNIVLSTILEKDMNGKADFYKRLDDPKMLFKAAWFVEKGDDAFNMIHEYYKKQIDSVRKSAYEKGKIEATGGTPSKTSKTNYTRTDKSKSPNGRKLLSIEDL